MADKTYAGASSNTLRYDGRSFIRRDGTDMPALRAAISATLTWEDLEIRANHLDLPWLYVAHNFSFVATGSFAELGTDQATCATNLSYLVPSASVNGTVVEVAGTPTKITPVGIYIACIKDVSDVFQTIYAPNGYLRLSGELVFNGETQQFEIPFEFRALGDPDGTDNFIEFNQAF